MSLKSIMSTKVVTVRSNDLLSTAAQMMLWSGGRHLPVVDGDELVGILSEGDVFRARIEVDRAQQLLVRDAMTKPVKTVAETVSTAVAAHRMATDKIGCLPVVRAGKLVGIVTTTDVLNAMESDSFLKQRQGLEDELGAEVLGLRTLRDRARVKAHLGRMDLLDAWHDLQGDIAQAERLIATAASNATSFVRKVRQRAETLLGDARRKAEASAVATQPRGSRPRSKTASSSEARK